MMNYKAIHIVFKKQEEADIITALLSDYPFEGFEEKQQQITAYISCADMPLKEELRRTLKGFPFSVEEVEHQNWNKLWESNYPSVLIEDFCGIRAEFHPHFEKVNYEITITPRMSFGTGHHATTKLMIRMMKALDFEGKRVLDFGTGTGVLSVLVDKMGAEKVVAVEKDPQAVMNAKENVKENNASVVTIYRQEYTGFLKENFDIVLANITKNIILENADGLWSRLREGGTLLLSGLLKKDVEEVTEKFLTKGADCKHLLQQEEWRGIQFQKGKE